MNMIPSNFRRPAYHEQFGPGAVRDVARTSLPPISLSQDGLPVMNYSPPSSIVRGPSMIPRPPINMPAQNGTSAINYSPPSVIQKLSGGGAGYGTLPDYRHSQSINTNSPGYGTLPDRGHSQSVNIDDDISTLYQQMSPEDRAIIDQRRAIDQGRNERLDAVLDGHNYRQGAVRDMRRVVGGVSDVQTPYGYTAPLSNLGNHFEDYTGNTSDRQFRSVQDRLADREIANAAMREQANRESNMMSGDLSQRMQRLQGGNMSVGPPRTDGTVMITGADGTGRYMTVHNGVYNPSTGQVEGTVANPVNNSMANFQRSSGGYSERVQQRAKERLAAQGFKTDEEQNQEMARRRASYMADVNSNSERSRQMRRAERMGLIPRGSATPVRGRAGSGNMIPSVRRKNDVAKLGDSVEPEVFGTARPLPGLDQNVSDVVRVFDEQNDMNPDQAKEFFRQTATATGNSASDMFDAMVKAAARSKFGFPDEPNEEPNKVAQEESRTASERASGTYRGTLSKQQQDKFDKDVEKEIEKLQTSHKKKHDIHKGTVGRRTPSLQGGFGGVFYPTY